MQPGAIPEGPHRAIDLVNVALERQEPAQDLLEERHDDRAVNVVLLVGYNPAHVDAPSASAQSRPQVLTCARLALF
jgi:hypothetical protein